MQSTTLAGLMMASPFALAQAKPDALTYKLQGTDIAGKKLDLNHFSGRTVLVSFFTFDCDLCSHDLKLMREFYVSNAKKKFVLLGVNIDQNKKDLDEYNDITTHAYPKDQRFPTVWRNAPGHSDNFGKIVTQPTHFVLDPKHQLAFKREGTFQPGDWDKLWLSLE
ncbi:TlpA family protein disulfide reductase [Undibacterium sp. Jales W-56]|uniref:TlpA disulfide reductase family protein n=1 Tax=Undibacterium sp. Jales W-56 TaxID=2897325 RepID=UPI0021D321D3|nr:TlpA disulfide reductase family protein [Undibacterium sp. Jales W-56]MCU6434572.1 TlpA family protein disulfide reductase [Undibacterium sp. Jales W-56]